LRVELDLRNEKINYKVREHSLAKVPVLLVVGKKETENRAVSIRRLGSQEQKVVGLDEALAGLVEEAVAPDVRRRVVDNPQEIESTVRLASLRQIHAAIDHLHKSEFESAITLASAAEGVLPKTDKPHLFPKLQTLIASLPEEAEGATGINDFTNWTKHGGKYERATIPELEVIATIARAVSKFVAVYGEQSSQMKEFSEWAVAHLQTSNN
jgi:hypothetical protein